MMGACTHAECRQYEITTKRKEVHGIDPAGLLGLYEREGKPGVVQVRNRAIALAGPLVKSKDASKPREQ
jgi:hypothetical protein